MILFIQILLYNLISISFIQWMEKVLFGFCRCFNYFLFDGLEGFYTVFYI